VKDRTSSWTEGGFVPKREGEKRDKQKEKERRGRERHKCDSIM
jgi:hypothetical protein